jgi:hypothetical protein
MIPVMCAPAFVLLLAVQASNGPSPTPSKPAQPEQQQARPKQTQTTTDNHTREKGAPSVTQPITAVRTAEQSKRRKVNEDRAPVDWRLIWDFFSSAMLTIFTGAIAWLAHRQHKAIEGQGESMKAQLAEMQAASNDTRLLAHSAKDTAEATKCIAAAAASSARTAEQSLKLGQRADLVARNFIIAGTASTPELLSVQFADIAAIRFEIANIGLTRAAVTETVTCFTLSQLPEPPDYSGPNRSGIVSPFAIAPNDKRDIRIQLTDEELAHVMGFRGPITIFGYVTYVDVFGGQHCLRYARQGFGVSISSARGTNTERSYPLSTVTIAGYEEST